MTPTQFVDEFAKELPIGPYTAIKQDGIANAIEWVQVFRGEDGHFISIDDAARLLLGAIVEELEYFCSQDANDGETEVCVNPRGVKRLSGAFVPGTDLFSKLRAACAARRKARGA